MAPPADWRRQLTLVLDLDNTLIHTEKSQKLIGGKKPKDLFVLEKMGDLVTKIRPHTREFLESLHPMYDLHVFTTASRQYASQITVLLDPDGRFFQGDKIFCRDDLSKAGEKAIAVVPSPPESVVVLDDSVDVWRKPDRENVLEVKGYYHCGFRGNGEKRGQDEDTTLLNLLPVLKRLHSSFFSSGKKTKDVRLLLASIQREILLGCEIAFTGFLSAADPSAEPIWLKTQRLGAGCTMELDAEKVTHVVARNRGTAAVLWAVEHGKQVVSGEWIDEAYYSWKQPP